MSFCHWPLHEFPAALPSSGHRVLLQFHQRQANLRTDRARFIANAVHRIKESSGPRDDGATTEARNEASTAFFRVMLTHPT